MPPVAPFSNFDWSNRDFVRWCCFGRGVITLVWLVEVVARATGGAEKMDKAGQVILAMSYQRTSRRDVMTLEDVWV
jgi:hypothetical protein